MNNKINNGANIKPVIETLKCEEENEKIAAILTIKKEDDLISGIAAHKANYTDKIEIEAILVIKDENGEFKVENGIAPIDKQNTSQMSKEIILEFF